jgi:hypothetical protein
MRVATTGMLGKRRRIERRRQRGTNCSEWFPDPFDCVQEGALASQREHL